MKEPRKVHFWLPICGDYGSLVFGLVGSFLKGPAPEENLQKKEKTKKKGRREGFPWLRIQRIDGWTELGN